MLLEESEYPFSRRQFTPGHITCTAVVLDPRRERVLLMFHHRLLRWLLPGGHCEGDDTSISGVARREAIEETGVEIDAIAGGRRWSASMCTGFRPRRKSRTIFITI